MVHPHTPTLNPNQPTYTQTRTFNCNDIVHFRKIVDVWPAMQRVFKKHGLWHRYTTANNV